MSTCGPDGYSQCLRRDGRLFLLSHRNESLAPMIARSELDAEQMHDWKDVLAPIFRGTACCIRAQLSGDFRGLDDVPYDLQGQDLDSKWSNIAGRWRSLSDLRKCCNVYGASRRRNNLLSTEAYLDYGYLGHHDFNYSTNVALATIQDR